jgi:hypothetical protein
MNTVNDQLKLKLIKAYNKSFEQYLLEQKKINYSNIQDIITNIEWVSCEVKTENLDFIKLIKGKDELLNFKGTVHANILTQTQNSQMFKYGFDAYDSVVCYSIDSEEFSIKGIGDIRWNEKK